MFRFPRVLIATLLPALSMLLASTEGPLHAQDWVKIRVTDEKEGRTNDLTTPSVVIDAAYTVHIVFQDGSPVHTSTSPVSFGSDLRYTNDASGTFARSTIVSQGTGSPAALALDSSYTLDLVESMAAASDEPGSPSHTWSIKWNQWNLGHMFDAPTEISGIYPTLAVGADGKLHATFEAGGDIYYCSGSRASGWSKPVRITTDPVPENGATIAVGRDGTVHIVFLRWKSGNRRTLCYVKGVQGTLDPPVELRTMPASTTGFDAIDTWPPFGPSVAVDPAGVCHLVFTSVFGTNPAGSSRLFHMENRGGVWGDPVAISPVGTYNRSAIAVGESGELHVAAEYLDMERGDWDIIYVERNGETWSAQLDLTSGNNADDLAAPNGGRFIAVRGDVVGIAYYTSEWRGGIGAGRGTDVALLIKGGPGGSSSPILTVDPLAIDFGLVETGNCRPDSIDVRNTGGGTLAIARPVITGGDSSQFKLSAPGAPVELGLGGLAEIMTSFCPTDTGCFTSRILLQTSIGLRYVMLSGCGGAPIISVDSAELDFGDIPFLNCLERSFTVTNTGSFPLEISDQLISDPSFTVVVPRPSDFRLEPGGSRQVTVRFCAADTGRVEGRLEFVGNAFGAPTRVQLKARGLRPTGGRTVSLDTASANVGDRVELLLKVSPPILRQEEITRVAVWLRIDSTALFMHLPAEPGTTRGYLEDGSILFERFTIPDSLSILARLPFEGLATGRAQNAIHIDSVLLEGGIRRVTRRGDGMILLSGCDVGTDLGYARRIAFRSIDVPSGDDAVLTFDALSGVVAELTVVDLMGRIVHRETLPAGTGGTQSARVRTGELPAGLYIMEMRDRAERVSLPVMIAK